MKLKIGEKNFLLGEGLTVFIGETNTHSLYVQFSRESLFGVNFSYGSHDKTLLQDKKIFVVDGELFGHSTLGYYGQCLNLPKGVKKDDLDRTFMGLCFEKEWFRMFEVCLNYLLLNINTYDFIIFNNVDSSFDAVHKILFFRIAENISKRKTVLICTEDIGSLRLSDIKFNIIDPEEKTSEFFNLIDSIQKGNFDQYIQKKISDDTVKRQGSEKKLATGKKRRPKLQSQDK